MKRVAIVVQRYGVEINGGAEHHARMLAIALRPYYELDVLTSRALDYRTWDLHYPPGEQWIDGCRVLRFDHPPRHRGRRKLMPIGRRLTWKLRWKLRARLARPGRALVEQPSGLAERDGMPVLRAQGPTMDGLLQHLQAHGGDYAAIVYMTALYHPTAAGVLLRPERAILVPTLHDEKMMYLPHFHRVFRAPRWIMYNTRAEQALAQRLYGADIAPGEVCGVGVEVPEAPAAGDADAAARWAELATRHGIEAPYLLYVGRIDAAKGCDELFRYFLRWRAERAAAMQLVVVGQAFMELPADPSIVYTGFVSEQDRDRLIEHAQAMVVPSRYESLSLVLLEAMARGCPPIVTRQSEVLLHHVADAGAGLAYDGYEEFAAALSRVGSWSPDERAAQAERGRRYVRERYDWSQIVAKFRRVIEAMPA